MRFAAVPPKKLQPSLSPAAEFIRRLVGADRRPTESQVDAKAGEVPPDLDQRVRLVGEW